MLEYPSKYDGFAIFKPIFDKEKNFLDYMFINSSDTFDDLFKIRKELLIGKKITDIMITYESQFKELEEIVFHMIPRTRKKFEIYLNSVKRLYMLSIFSDESDYLLLFLNDISRIKKPHWTGGNPVNDDRKVMELSVNENVSSLKQAE